MSDALPDTDHGNPRTPRPALPFFLLLIAFLILICTSVTAFLVHNNEAQKLDKVNEIFGQQRTLVYRYVSKISYILVALSANDMENVLNKKRALDDVSDIFEQTYQVLLNGGTINFPEDPHVVIGFEIGVDIGTVEPINDATARDMLQNIHQQWSELKHIALLSLRSNSFAVGKSPYFQNLLDQANITVNQINATSEYIITENEIRLKRMDLLLFTTIGATLLLLLFIGYYVYNRFIKPLDQTFRQLTVTAAALAQERDRVEKSSNAKSEFLSHMSHELRTPLNAILGYSQLLELDIDAGKPTNREYVMEMLGAGQHLLTLIDEVLDLQKIESGKIDITAIPTRVDNMLHECLPLVTRQAEQRHLTISDNVSQQDYIVRADPQRFKQVMLNILSNAVKYSEESGRISIDAGISNGNKLRISVTNSGAGLSHDDINRLFQPFERLNYKHEVDGTGIGLVICKHLIELMGGSIGVDSDLGNTTTFWFELERIEVS